MSSPLDGIRAQLDDVDRRLVQALSDRARLIQTVAELKRGGNAVPLRDVEREEGLLTRVVSLASETSLDATHVTRLYREILDHSLRLQQGLLGDVPDAVGRGTVAYQGRAGSYSHQAAERHFAARPGEFELQGLDTFRAILEAVRDGAADYAMLPI